MEWDPKKSLKVLKRKKKFLRRTRFGVTVIFLRYITPSPYKHSPGYRTPLFGAL